ncbi:MAG TPA: fumarylacetoacetate hydrolase family protein [Burkholderiales bacterium]|jgi:2-keto-4-pentenoate hydratase/2-oxohepta-3-ene-1,7-dioic acid hydratase in catechol pathway|nr:fumarylacetoacetate hydrolase family protein [Burkholderiales bacterium]
MRLCRFDDQRLGLVQGERVHDVTEVLERLPAVRYPLPAHDPLVANLGKLAPHIAEAARKAPGRPVSSVKLLSPVANPGKIIAAPVNYRKHLEEALADKGINFGKLVDEIQKIGMFLKATSSLAGAGEGVRLVKTDRRNDHEVELAVVIGKEGRNIPKARALDYVAGYCIGLDITIRGPEERSLRKSVDTYSVLGPWLVTADEFGDPSNVQVGIKVNGAVRQDANTSDLVMPIPELIEYMSAFYSLRPGDVIMTGTPQGVGPIKPGDVMEAWIDRVGAMTVAVTAA